MANRTILEEERAAKPPKSAKKSANGGGKNASLAERERIFELFRRWGFYESNLDPLGFLEPIKRPELNLTAPAADDLYNILFRLQAPRMINKGYEWGTTGRSAFAQDYGVLETITKITPAEN